MGPPLSSAKVILLAVHFATHSDGKSLASLYSQYPSVLSLELLLRIVLTHFPETAHPSTYVPLITRVDKNDTDGIDGAGIDDSPVIGLSEEKAGKRARKLHLLPLSSADVSHTETDDLVTLFAFRRAYRMESVAGLLSQVTDLILPFNYKPLVQTWLISTILPFKRRIQEYYYSETPPIYTLEEFGKLSNGAATEYLLSCTCIDATGNTPDMVIRDLRGLVAPWLFNDQRWVTETSSLVTSSIHCPGWEHVLEWLIAQASNNGKLIVDALRNWNGPSQDADLGPETTSWLSHEKKLYLQTSYARAILSAVYLMNETSVEAISDAYLAMSKVKHVLEIEPDESLRDTAQELPNWPNLETTFSEGVKSITLMRNNLLAPSNPLTQPTENATLLLRALILSAYLLARHGISFTVRQAGELYFRGDEREQKSHLAQIMKALSTPGPKNSDQSWVQARKELLWLQGCGDSARGSGKGLLAALSRQYVETEFLSGLLANSREYQASSSTHHANTNLITGYDLARSIYEESQDSPLPPNIIQDIVLKSALNAFDNASNPNRTRGGLKKCDEM